MSKTPVLNWNEIKGFYFIKATDAEFVLDVLAAPFDIVDAHGQYFSKNTDFILDNFNKPLIIYRHGVDDQKKFIPDPVEIGNPLKYWADKIGLWFKVKLDQTKAEAVKVWEAAKAGKVSVSSGSISHLVRPITPDGGPVPGEIKKWGIAEISLWDYDPNLAPANPMATAIPALKMKSLYEIAGRKLPEMESRHTINPAKMYLFFNEMEF